MTLKLGKWESKKPLFATRDRPLVLGVSGGRTSAMMAALADEKAILCFQNTGREHPGTYEFLGALDDALGGRLVWLEFRKPLIKGDRPANARFEVVNYKTADRSGRPFSDMMETLAEYRQKAKGLPPVSPWARSRICTSHMKIRVRDHYIKSLGIPLFEACVGLRADEPDRVHALKSQASGTKKMRAPLFDAGITKKDVLEFWAGQKFDLGIQERQGNCTGCFLKDQADLSRVMAEPESDSAWWEAMQAKYPQFGGRDHAGYKRLREELPARLGIEKALKAGVKPVCPVDFKDERRFLLLVAQEKKRLKGQTSGIACNCEGAATMADFDDDAEDKYLLGDD